MGLKLLFVQMPSMAHEAAFCPYTQCPAASTEQRHLGEDLSLPFSWSLPAMTTGEIPAPALSFQVHRTVAEGHLP